MADLSDIENALVTLVAGVLFPSTSYLAGAVQSSAPTGATIKLYRGWPDSNQLNADMLAGNVNVSVFSDPGMTRNVTRWMPSTQQAAMVAPTLTATVSGAAITLGGTITAGNVLGVLAGAPKAAYAYIVKVGDTLATVASAIAAKISGASSAGAVVMLPSVPNIAAAVMTPQPAITVTRQQEQGVRISIWAPTPQVRDAVVSAIDGAIASLKNANGYFTRFFAVGTYEQARIAYKTSYTNDMPSRDRIWRRDLCFTIEYPTTLLEQNPVMLFGGGTETIGNSGTTRQLGAIAPS